MKLRKLFLIAAVVSPLIFFQGCSKDGDEVDTEVVNGGNNFGGNNVSNSNDGETQADLSELDWNVEWDYISDDFFPSWTYMQLINKQFADAPECISISIPQKSEGARLKLTVEGNEFMDQTIVEETISADMIKNKFFSPDLNWKQDALINASTKGFFNMNAVLEINGKVVQRFNKRVNYHSINECVYAVTGTKDGVINLRPLFSIYVNEDNPNIDKILKQCLALGENRQFVGNQWTKDDVLEQMWWVWQYFSMRGTTYSDITTTSSNVVESSDGTTLYNQYVRFFDQCYNEKQANCVDGSCLLASIYRKIGLDVALVLVPGHCLLAVRPQTSDVKGHEDENVIFLETTCMGNTKINGVQYNPNNEGDNKFLFQNAVTFARDKVVKNLKEYGEEKVGFVYINDARANGIMPIQRTLQINVDVLEAPEVTDFTPLVLNASFNKSEHKYIGYYYNEQNANDNISYDYRYTIGFSLYYPNVQSTKEIGFRIGNASYFNSNFTEGQGYGRYWSNLQSMPSGTMYYYSNSTSATVYVQAYCIDKYGIEHRSSIERVSCVYSATGTK